jgi:hypothetical protein
MGLRFSEGFGPSGCLILGGDFAVLQAPEFEGPSFDAPTFLDALTFPVDVDTHRSQASSVS